MELNKSKANSSLYTAIGVGEPLGIPTGQRFVELGNRLSTAVTGLKKVRNYASTCADWISIFPKQGLASNYLNNVVTMIDQVLASLEEPFNKSAAELEQRKKEFYDRQHRLL